jgi:hypothetical protein
MASISRYTPNELSMLVVATQIQAAALPEGPERDHLLLLATAFHGCAMAQHYLDR